MKSVINALENRYPNISIIADLQQKPGDEVPPLIGGFRPDVYASQKQENLIIAEAKTDNDIDNQHTWDQTTSFITHSNNRKTSFFILVVTGQRADLAKTLLRFVRIGLQDVRTEIEVFDGCDFWRLDSKGGIIWDLL